MLQYRVVVVIDEPDIATTTRHTHTPHHKTPLQVVGVTSVRFFLMVKNRSYIHPLSVQFIRI